MATLSTSSLFFIIAMLYSFFIARNYYQNDKQYTLQAKIWSVLVVIFLTVAVLL